MEINIILLFTSFIAGVLTLLAPCVFTLLPAIIGGSVGGNKTDKYKPYVVGISLGISIILFTALLSVSTSFLAIPDWFWNGFSGAILLLFGYFTLVPEHWDYISFKFGLSAKSNKALDTAESKKGLLGDVLVGFSLGPVFTSCSPTYFVIVGAVFPESFAVGLLYTVTYAVGLVIPLIMIGIAGQSLISKLKWAMDPHGVFKRVLGMLFLLMGWSILFGLHKDVQTYIVQNIPQINISNVESVVLEKYDLF